MQPKKCPTVRLRKITWIMDIMDVLNIYESEKRGQHIANKRSLA